MQNETQTFKDFLATVQVGKIKSGKDIDAIIEQARKEGFTVPETFETFADKKDFLKELIVLSAGETEPTSNTNGAKAPENPKEYDGPMASYKVISVIEVQDQDGNQTGFLEEGSIQEVPEYLGDGWVEAGLAEKVVEKKETKSTKSQARRVAIQEEAQEPEVKHYQGSMITSESTRVMHGNTYTQIVCANGQTFLLSKDEYAKEVK